MVCNIFDAFSLLLPDEKIPDDISVIQQREVKAAQAGCLMELFTFLYHKMGFPFRPLQLIEEVFLGIFFSLSIVLIKK